MLQVTCPCGKVAHGSEAMAGQPAQCMKCGRTLVFPAPRRAAPVAVAAGVESFASALLDPLPGQDAPADGADSPAPAADEQAAPPSTSRLPCERYYWVFLVALAPLGF